MRGLNFSIEGLSPELITAYAQTGMERGKQGVAALEWSFGGNDKAFAVARSDNKIVGISAYIKSQMLFGSRRGNAYQAVDSFVFPEARGRGLFNRLATTYAHHLRDQDADLIWGFPNDNAAPAWFGKLGWTKHGQVPFLFKPLRSGYFLRKLHLTGDFKIARGTDQNLARLNHVGPWVDQLWEQSAANVHCGTTRNEAFLNHRLFDAPHAAKYRVVGDDHTGDGAFVATRTAEKHGGKVAYVMEAFGGSTLQGVLTSEMSRLRDNGTELALAWSYPWSENYKTLRKCGFLPLPEKLRPINIWFGGKAVSPTGQSSKYLQNWYLSYLDSDTI